jgi:hypothetical protein
MATIKYRIVNMLTDKRRVSREAAETLKEVCKLPEVGFEWAIDMNVE